MFIVTNRIPVSDGFEEEQKLSRERSVVYDQAGAR